MNTRLFFFSVAAIVLAACTQMENPSESNVPITLTYSTVAATETKAAQNLNEGTFASGEDVKVRISNTGADSWTDYTFTTAAAGAMTAPTPRRTTLQAHRTLTSWPTTPPRLARRSPWPQTRRPMLPTRPAT